MKLLYKCNFCNSLLLFDILFHPFSIFEILMLLFAVTPWKIGLLVMGVIGGIIACIRCKHCLIHKWLTHGKCWKKHEQIEASKFAKTNLLKDKALSQDRIATFQDVMLVRSISMGKGWFLSLRYRYYELSFITMKS